MRKLSLLLLTGTLFTVPAFAAMAENPTSSEKARIEQLEQEVRELTKELNAMRMQYTALQTRLQNARSILGGNATTNASNEMGIDVESCTSRLSALRQTQAKLQSLGYKSEHPDVVNIDRQTNKLTLECDGDKSGR